MARLRALGVGVTLFILIACGGASVPAYGPCSTATDSCGSSTVCESATPTSATFCTHSCSTSDDCPHDSSGAAVPCVFSTSSSSGYGFCFQECSAGSCPAGDTCATADGVSLCVPGLDRDPLSGTTWQSTSISTTATSDGVAASTYTITFASGAESIDGTSATGAFSATFTQTYSASKIYNLAGCTETTNFTGGTWTDNTKNSGLESFKISDATGSTTRTGCNVSTHDTNGEPSVYDEAVNAYEGVVFRIMGASMNFPNSTAGTPYDDNSPWTFTRTAP